MSNDNEANKGLPEDLISATKAAQQLGVHVSTVIRWVLRGRLPGWRRGGRVFVRACHLRRLFQRVDPVRPDGSPLCGPARPKQRTRRQQDRHTREVLQRMGLLPKTNGAGPHPAA